MSRQVEICVQFGDILEIQADIVALKYAQAFYGADHKIADRLAAANLVALDDIRLQPGEARCFRCQGVIRAGSVLFVGTTSLERFRYDDVRQWANKVMETLKSQGETARHVALTLHGRGFGLEPGAAFLSLLSGIVASIKSKQIPDSLGGISIVEREAETYLQLKELMKQRFFGESFITPSSTGTVYFVSV
jgi:hypothetical protein